MYTMIMGTYMEQLESNTTTGENIVFGFFLGWMAIAMTWTIKNMLQPELSSLEKKLTKRQLKKAVQRMVRDDVGSDYQNEHPIQAYLPSKHTYRDLTENESAYLQKIYEKYLVKTQKEFAKHKKTKHLCERLEHRRAEHHALLDELHPRTANRLTRQ